MYESFFGLTGLPFQLNPNPSFLFLGTGHRDAFAALQEGLAAGARVMVLTGEVGAGKTTLLQALLANVDPARYTTVQISASGLDAEMLSDRLAEALGQPGLSDPLARRDALLETIRSGPLSTLLVIDEGQHLAPSAFDLLETMAKAAESGPARLQICLVGQPELRILFNAAERSGFRELIGVDCHLRPLQQSEIRLYIEHRLHRVGWTGRPEFEDAAFTEIFIFTNGIPRRVNLLCNSLMLSAWLKRQPRIDAPAVTRAAAAIRGDSQGAPDLLEAGSLFEHAPTLTDEFESDAPGSDAARVQSDDTHPWTCPTCSSVNAASARECWSCEAARPGLDGPEQSPGDAAQDTHAGLIPATMSPRPDAVPAESATSTQRADDAPPMAMSDETPHADPAPSEPIDPSSAKLVHDQGRAARRRRQAILASAVSLAAVLALVAYVVNQQTSTAGRSQRELPNVVAKRITAPVSPAPAVETPPPRAATLSGPASSDIPSAHPPSPDLASSAVLPDAAPDHSAPPSAAPVTSPAGSCSAAAVALGLCDADQSPTTRR